MFISPVKKHKFYNNRKNIQNLCLQSEPLRFNIKFFHASVCNFTQKKFHVYFFCILINLIEAGLT